MYIVDMARGAADADVFSAIADPTRRRMLDLLAEGERAVSDLVAAFSLTQPSISDHLRVLREVGLVRVRREGRRRLYQLNPGKLKELADWVATYSRFWDKRLDALGSYLDRAAGETGPE